MKKSIRSYSSSRSGFTLVELLVVVAIIAILAAAVVAGAGGAINAAKRVKASNAATQIQTAIINYYTEYGVYPVPPGTTTDILYNDANNGTGNQSGLFFALCGNINPSVGTQGQSSTGDVPNTRQIAFMTPKKTDVDANGILINPFFTSTTAPPNQGYFNIAIDADYSGILGDSGSVTGKMPDFSGGTWKTGSTVTYLANGITQGVAVWACCDTSSLPPKQAASKTPNFWVHTY